MDSDTIHVAPWRVHGRSLSIQVPGSFDKSFTHRAIMLASMANGASRIVNPLMGEDCLATRRIFESLGVNFIESQMGDQQMEWTVISTGRSQWNSPGVIQDLGNSGTSARLLLGLFSGVEELTITINGDESLQKRPMGRVVEPLRNMGAQIAGTSLGSNLPLTITGSILTSRSHNLRVASAQLKSAILFGATNASGVTVIDIPEGGRNHTEIMFQSLGANLSVTNYLGREQISMIGPWTPAPFDCRVPMDPSSVSFFAALAALHPGMEVFAKNVLCNKTRIGFFTVLQRMGLRVCYGEQSSNPAYLGECVRDVSFLLPQGQVLKAVHLKSSEVPSMIDEIPIMGVVCSMIEGRSKIEGLSELRVKESDRLLKLGQLLESAGVEVHIEGDAIEIMGTANLNAFSFSSDDHRMLMSAIILATRCRDSSKINGLRWISTSFPLFLEAFQNINLLAR